MSKKGGSATHGRFLPQDIFWHFNKYRLALKMSWGHFGTNMGLAKLSSGHLARCLLAWRIWSAQLRFCQWARTLPWSESRVWIPPICENPARERICILSIHKNPAKEQIRILLIYEKPARGRVWILSIYKRGRIWILPIYENLTGKEPINLNSAYL